MQIENIEKFIEHEERVGRFLTIHFKDRQSTSGRFIQQKDYEDLKKKNFWRVVKQANMELWETSRNLDLVDIFSGLSFVKISENK